jgi:hypothetical protein
VAQWSAHTLSARDTENHFHALAATGDVQKALAILDGLDAEDGKVSFRACQLREFWCRSAAF